MNEYAKDILVPSLQVQLDEEAFSLSRSNSNVSSMVKRDSMFEKGGSFAPINTDDEEAARREERRVLRKLDLRILPFIGSSTLLCCELDFRTFPETSC